MTGAAKEFRCKALEFVAPRRYSCTFDRQGQALRV